MILCRTGIGKDVRMSIDRLDPGTNRRRDGFGRVQGGEKNMIEGRATAAACRKFNFSTSLLAISMFAGLAGTAHAQEAIEPAGDQPIEGGDDIVVTGSRIGRPVLDLPTPRTVERRGGKACVSTCESRWSRQH